jgi:SAM-dependent methyltransferase
MYVIRLFSFCLPMFGDEGGRVILDAGCAYAWTTDWMAKCGHEPMGIDITRPYLEVAKQRLGDQIPYLVVGDTENLPVRDEVLDGVLGFEAFHHIPNRNRAMHEFFRTMKEGGLIVLAEPPSAHETVEHVQEVMRKYGILEKGMDLADVRAYVENTGLGAPVQHYVLKVDQGVIGTRTTEQFLRDHSYTPANLFTIRKQQPVPVARPESVFARVRAVVSRALAFAVC